MKVAILQPIYLPWLGYFEHMDAVDVLVICDDVIYNGKEWLNKNKIKSSNGVLWLTVPVMFRMGDLIKEVVIDGDGWKKSHVRNVKNYYEKAIFFVKYFDELKSLIMNSPNNLCELNIQIILWIKEKLGIKTKVVRASELDYKRDVLQHERIINICKVFGADVYLTGEKAISFIMNNKNAFYDAGINVLFQKYKHPVYRQMWGSFIPYLSVIDLLFCEEKPMEVIRRGREWMTF